VIYAALTSVQNGPVYSLLDNIYKAQAWFAGHVSPVCGGPTCIPPIRGNVNYDGADLVNISDLTFLVAYLFTGGATPECPDEANVNGDPAGAINIADLTTLVAYLFSGGAPPAACP